MMLCTGAMELAFVPACALLKKKVTVGLVRGLCG